MTVESNGTVNGRGGLNGSVAIEAPSARGVGASRLDLLHSVSDMELLHKALARWPRRFSKIDSAMRDRMVKEAQVMLDGAAMCQDVELAEKMRATALRVLTQMDRLNSVDEGRALNAVLGAVKAKESAPSVVNNTVNILDAGVAPIHDPNIARESRALSLRLAGIPDPNARRNGTA
jgi:hypothetical protein